MSRFVRSTINLCKNINAIKPLNNFTINLNQILINRPIIQCLRTEYYSTIPPENVSVSDDMIIDHNYVEINSETNQKSESFNASIGRNVDMNRVQEFWRTNEITVHGNDAPLPVFDFHECQWPPKITSALESDGFSSPTAIQSQGWPIALSGRDMVGIAQTGSGKTLCYVLPAFVKIMREGVQRGPKCLVLAPTRELAQQIQTVVKRFRLTNNVCLYGGASRVPQMQILRESNPQIVIATPGRLNDFVESNAINLQNVSYLVLDEADRMLDMGFEPQIRRIINCIPEDRQTLMWSATWPEEVKTLAAQFMRDFVQINVGGTQLIANKNIKQIIQICNPYDKINHLMSIIEQYPQQRRGENKILIFTKTKRTADFLVNKLKSCGRHAMSTHSDKSQSQRDFVLNEFRSGRNPILCATDVAARGLDVNDIEVVINYDFPNCTEDYVHRIGRTGRSNNKGIAYTLFTEEDKAHAMDLIEVMRESEQEISGQLSELANQAINSKKQKRVWGYEPRNQSFPQRQQFGGNRRFAGNDRYSDNNYDRRPNQFEDYGQREERFDNRYAYKKDLRNKYYSNRSPMNDEYNE